MELLKLKNGSEEVKSLVVATMMSLQGLLDSNPITFYELVELCKDSDHEVWGDCIKDLQKLNLVTNGKIHESIKNIVLSAVTGNGLDLILKSPVE